MGKNNNSKNKPDNKSGIGSNAFADALRKRNVELEKANLSAPEEKKVEDNASYRGGEVKKSENKKDNIKGVPYAPYNFVPVSDIVLEDTNKIGHNEISDQVYSGEIKYRFTAKTPILVDDGTKQFFQNKNGVCAVPGSTMRGLIRSNIQILGFSSVREDIDDYYLMYRAVAGGCLRRQYGEILGQSQKTVNGHKISVLKNVKAGYISKKGNTYYLYNNILDNDNSLENDESDYYTVSEKYVLEKAKDKFKYITPSFQNEVKTLKDKNGHIQYKIVGKDTYLPYSLPISYELSNNSVSGIEKENVLEHSGYAISSGKMQGKKAFYVIPEIDKNTKTEIPKEVTDAYKKDYNKREKTLLSMGKKDGETEDEKNDREDKIKKFYQLPEDGETRPVFYIVLEGKMYIGYMPHLRLMYNHTILEGLHQDQSVSYDYSRTMLGSSDSDSPWKSKVFFTDAIWKGKGEPAKADEKNLVLAEPKPTSYLEYLKQDKYPRTYNSDDKELRLRGVKQYWLHNPEKFSEEESQVEKKKDNESIKSVLHPLDSGNSFEGSIRFQNLSKEELGLLLWSIRLEENSRMNIGKGKPYGYGQIEFDKIDLYLIKPKEYYKPLTENFSAEMFSMNPLEKNDDIDSFIIRYKDFASEELNKKGKSKHPQQLMSYPPVRDFLEMKSNVMTRNVEYMGLQSYQTFKQKDIPLPSVKDITNKTKDTNK